MNSLRYFFMTVRYNDTRMYLKVQAMPGAKREKVTRIAEDRYLIAVREPAERNLANGRIRTLVARECGVQEGSVKLISGHRSPHKIFSVEK